MKRIFLHLIYNIAAVTCLFAVSSCYHEVDTWDHPKKTMDRTLIFYMAGENSLSHYVAADSVEMAAGLSQVPEGCRIVQFLDDARSSRICVGTREHPFETVQVFPRNICSTDSADMEMVLSYIFKRYPAESYGLVMWSHASGWVFFHNRPGRQRAQNAPRRTFGIDNSRRSSIINTGVQMDVTTLARVLSHHPHFDYIFFDACFMQCIEVAYELRDVADWVLGSPAEIPGDGAPYTDIMRALASVEVAPNQILQPYYDYYVTGFGHMSYHGALLSAVKTSELSGLAAATKPLLRRLLAGRQLLDCSDVQRYCPLDSSQQFTEFYDMANVLYKHVSADEYALWQRSLERAVPYRYLSSRWSTGTPRYSPMLVDDPDHCAAVSMYVPTAFYDNLWWVADDLTLYNWTDEYHQLKWYDAVGMSETGW